MLVVVATTPVVEADAVLVAEFGTAKRAVENWFKNTPDNLLLNSCLKNNISNTTIRNNKITIAEITLNVNIFFI